jgi:hypothetical protein
LFRRSSPTSATFDVSLELGGDDELGSPLLPGFAHPVRALFAQLARNCAPARAS